jgi:two-component system, cell cycle response regulator CpdR
MAAPAPQGRGRTVLIVDDDAMLRKILGDTLTDAGHSVLTAADGQEALSIAATLKGQLGLVVTDIRMPGMDGLELAGHLAELDPAPRVLFISAFAATTAAAIPGPILDKPFRAGQLLDQVARML